MKKEDFVHSLRIQLTPDGMIEKRTSDLVEHCKKYGFNDVMLMINAEEFNFGHITIEEAAPWVEKLKDVKRALLDAGICVSLNNWMELGHLSRGRKLKEKQNFTTMLDFNGTRSELVACPLDSEWQDYFCDYAGYLCRELEPDYFWIEDDFRYHNHAPLSFGGCFCEKHIARFNDMLGTSYTREEFISRAFAKGKITPERKAWLDCERESLVALADRIARAIKKASPNTCVALMSSEPDSHCMEARDWRGILCALAQGGDRINRIHLPAYAEASGKDYIYNFNRVSMAVRHFSSDEAKIWPEVENGAPNFFKKSPRFLRFHVEGSMPLILDGMTYSLYGFSGNGTLDKIGYGKEINELRPYLSAVRKRNIRFSSMRGVTVPIFEDICYDLEIEQGFSDLRPKSFNTAAYLATLGISYEFLSERRYRNKTVVLFADSIYCFTDDELLDLFANNFVIVDGFVASKLCERGLGHLICATEVCQLALENTTYVYETLNEDREILGTMGYRSTIRGDMGRFFSVKYDDEKPVRVITSVRSYRGEITANGFAEGENFLVIPYMIDGRHGNQYCDLRRRVIMDCILEHAEMAICSEFEGVYPYLYAEEDRTHVMITNSLVDNIDEIKLEVKGLEVCKVSEICHDGIIRPVKFQLEEGVLIVNTALPQLSCVTLIIE